MARDQVHRIVGQEAIHGRAFGGGGIGGALAILRRGRDQRRLNQGRQHRTGIDLPDRQGEPGCRQNTDAWTAATTSSAAAAAIPARITAGRPPDKSRFRGHQREPHHQRRYHAAGQEREIADQ